MNLLVKISNYGVYTIYVYVGYILFLFCVNWKNIFESCENCEKMKLISTNIGNLSRNLAKVLTIHTNFAPIIKCNKDLSKNERDLGITFIIGSFIYSLIGLLGSFGVLSNFL